MQCKAEPDDPDWLRLQRWRSELHFKRHALGYQVSDMLPCDSTALINS